MTPFEKAKELFKKYYVEVTYGNSSIYSEMELRVFKIRAKTFALISVYEILNVACDVSDYDVLVTKQYWNEVKQEIENL
ncbi:MAG: hypothetical protein ACR2IM_06450 [Sediminibacterium sp.]